MHIAAMRFTADFVSTLLISTNYSLAIKSMPYLMIMVVMIPKSSNPVNGFSVFFPSGKNTGDDPVIRQFPMIEKSAGGIISAFQRRGWRLLFRKRREPVRPEIGCG